MRRFDNINAQYPYSPLPYRRSPSPNRSYQSPYQSPYRIPSSSHVYAPILPSRAYTTPAPSPPPLPSRAFDYTTPAPSPPPLPSRAFDYTTPASSSPPTTEDTQELRLEPVRVPRPTTPQIHSVAKEKKSSKNDRKAEVKLHFQGF